MSRGDRWGPDGPPPEAYSRLTDPERFRPLHAAADALLAELEASFDAQRTDGRGLDPELERVQQARPSVRLVPQDASAAPLVVAFTAFPGIGLRMGHWFTDRFPSCGCDACDETADGEVDRLRDMVENVVEGRFREAIELPLIGDGWQAYELWSRGGRSRGRSRIGRKPARAMITSAGRRSMSWGPWPRRALA